MGEQWFMSCLGLESFTQPPLQPDSLDFETFAILQGATQKPPCPLAVTLAWSQS